MIARLWSRVNGHVCQTQSERLSTEEIRGLCSIADAGDSRPPEEGRREADEGGGAMGRRGISPVGRRQLVLLSCCCCCWLSVLFVNVRAEEVRGRSKAIAKLCD